VAEERNDRSAVIVHGAGSVHYRLCSVPGHSGDHCRQRASLHRRVLGSQAKAPVQLPARIVGCIRPVCGYTRHADGLALPDPGQMAVRHVHV